MKRKIKKSAAFWTLLVGAGTAADLYCLRKGMYEDTLTHHGRRVTWTHAEASTRSKWIGRAVWILTAVWVVNHFAFGPHENGRVHRFVVDNLLGDRDAEA